MTFYEKESFSKDATLALTEDEIEARAKAAAVGARRIWLGSAE